ncbi:MAG TPA: hypothetical protein EYP04_00485 [Anaerolineae bacterium]|nr:hypothetical protein [Anaerolineae bacterium]
MANEQPTLFNQEADEAQKAAPVARLSPVTPRTSLAAATTAFREHMQRKEFSQYTVKAFLGDLRLLQRYLSAATPVGDINTRDLEQFLDWLVNDRGVPCNPKSLARRLTTLKVFFGWLTESEVLEHDPAAPIAHKPTRPPLPEILFDDEVERLLSVTRDNLFGQNPDARPYVLISLILQTGIKKGECVNIKLTDIDMENPRQPSVFIRYENPRWRHKERRLYLSPNLMPALKQYLREYDPRTRLFECTARNLEYVLEDAGKAAGLKKKVSFEMLRWTAAVRDYRLGMPPEQLRRKLGLSRVTWAQTEERIKKLAAPPL